jgi:O-acetylhomoserine (thiol)-lyase
MDMPAGDREARMAEARRGRQLETLLVHGGEDEPDCTGGTDSGRPTLPPVVLSTAYAHRTAEEMEAVFAGQAAGHVYSRMSNPTVEALERRIAALCGAAGALALASGMSAIASALLALLRAGDELIAGRFLFGGTYTLLQRMLGDLGVVTHFIDPRCPEEAEARIGERTRGIFLEAIGNPAMSVPDFAAYRAIADRHGVPILVDATLLTPALTDPEPLGADLLFYSGSKFLAGAASAVGGLIVDPGRFPWQASPRFDLGDFRRHGQGALLAKLRRPLMAGVGPCLSPLNAFLLLTGLETLALRLERQCAQAERLAAWLTNHPKVRAVRYPGLPGDPGHALALRQFRGRAGAVLCFELADKASCFRFLNALRLVQRVTNLGDTRTLAVHPQSTIYGTFWLHEQELLGVTPEMVRISVGIEHLDDIVQDLARGLEAA